MVLFRRLEDWKKKMIKDKKFASIEAAVKDIKNGKMVIVVDDPSRENEGDLVCAAQKATPEIINFMAKNARGLICVPVNGKTLDKLEINVMERKNVVSNK